MFKWVENFGFVTKKKYNEHTDNLWDHSKRVVEHNKEANIEIAKLKGEIEEMQHLDLENYKLNSALKNLELQLELQQIILKNTIANENGADTSTVKFNSIEQFATYLCAMNQALVSSVKFYINRPVEDIRKEIEDILEYK
ncbi:MAG: hypothetical protein ACRDD7_11555 [Peptostreptococcaceae bacterium]